MTFVEIQSQFFLKLSAWVLPSTTQLILSFLVSPIPHLNVIEMVIGWRARKCPSLYFFSSLILNLLQVYPLVFLYKRLTRPRSTCTKSLASKISSFFIPFFPSELWYCQSYKLQHAISFSRKRHFLFKNYRLKYSHHLTALFPIKFFDFFPVLFLASEHCFLSCCSLENCI